MFKNNHQNKAKQEKGKIPASHLLFSLVNTDDHGQKQKAGSLVTSDRGHHPCARKHAKRQQEEGRQLYSAAPDTERRLGEC